MFEMLGHEAHTANDGIEGLERAKAIKPDVIFCDIGLPGMSGYEVAKRLKEDADLKNVYLVALTGYAGDSDVELAKKNGFDRHLAKPVGMAAIERLLSEIPK